MEYWEEEIEHLGRYTQHLYHKNDLGRGNRVMHLLAKLPFSWSDFSSQSKIMHIDLIKDYKIDPAPPWNYCTPCRITDTMCTVGTPTPISNQSAALFHMTQIESHHTCSPASKSYCQTGLLIGRQDQRRYYKPIKVIGTDCQAMSPTA